MLYCALLYTPTPTQYKNIGALLFDVFPLALLVSLALLSKLIYTVAQHLASPLSTLTLTGPCCP